jgi:hypothetical protein
MVLKTFLWGPWFFASLIKPPCFQEIDRKCLKYVETQWATGWGDFFLPTGWRPGGKCTYWSSLVLGISQSVSAVYLLLSYRCWESLQYYSGISPGVTNTLKLLLKWSPKTSFSNSLGINLGISSQFPRSSMLLFINIKNWRHNKKIELWSIQSQR